MASIALSVTSYISTNSIKEVSVTCANSVIFAIDSYELDTYS